MASRRTFTFSIPDEMKAGLTFLRARDGIAEAEQIRRGIVLWLESRGVLKKQTAPRRGDTRRKA